MYQGETIPVMKLVNGHSIVNEDLDKLTPVYALLFKTDKYVKFHNLDVLQWSEAGFNEFLSTNKLQYCNGFINQE